MEGGLAGVGTGTLPDHCKEGGVGQVSHQLQPWPSSLLLSLSYTLSASFNHPPPASHPPLVPLLCSYKSISFPSLPPPGFLQPPLSHCASLSLYRSSSSSLATPLPPFIVGSAVGVERSEVGRREGEKEAEAMRECENERVSVFNQRGVGQITSLVFLFLSSTLNNC